MNASSLANGVLNTPLQVLEFLRDEGGIDVKRYDESLVEDLRAALNEAPAPSHLPTGDIEIFL